MSNEIPELTENDFNNAITRAQRQRLESGDWEAGDLTALRKFVGLTQKDFAVRIGISVGTLRNWEQQRRNPEGPAKALLRLLAKHPGLIIKDLKKVS